MGSQLHAVVARKKEMIVLMEGGVAHENNSTRLRNQRSSAFGGGAED
jgi:hypothetical protein